MTLQGGDPVFPEGDDITVVNTGGTAIEAGELVSVTGHNGQHTEVGLADVSDAGDYFAVAKNDAADGEALAVKARGVPLTKVESGLVAGDELATPDSGGTGTAGVGASGGGRGDYLLDDAEEFADGDHYAPVQLD